MGAFSMSVRKNIVKAKARVQAAFVNTAIHAHRSVQKGSTVTGAPGQPVDSANLMTSWQLTFPTPTRALVSTNTPYAESNEDGIARPGGGPYIQRSAIGGRHSVSKTKDGLDKIVRYETKLLRRGDR